MSNFGYCNSPFIAEISYFEINSYCIKRVKLSDFSQYPIENGIIMEYWHGRLKVLYHFLMINPPHVGMSMSPPGLRYGNSTLALRIMPLEFAS